MVVVKKTSLLRQNRISRHSFTPPRRSMSIHPNVHHQTNKELLKDRVAERFFVKRTRRSNDLSAITKRISMSNQLKSASTAIDEAMKRKGFSKQSFFYLGPKVPSSPADRRVFSHPKHYVCEGCDAKMWSVHVYVKHLRKHKLSIRCSSCDCCFKRVLDKRRHELHCEKKTRLRF